MESILTVVASINKALEIAQSKGAFTLQQSAATYNNLQTLSKYFEKIKQKYDQEQAQEQEIQGISHMTQEEAIDSENQENRGVILNEKEQKEVEKINAIEDQMLFVISGKAPYYNLLWKPVYGSRSIMSTMIISIIVP